MSTLTEQGYRWLSLEEFYRESPDVDAAEAIRDCHPGFSGLWCRYMMNCLMSVTLEDVVVLAHGPAGCPSASRTFIVNFASINMANPFLYLPTSAMSQTEVIFGGEEKLADAIRAVDREYRPSLIFVVTNCCAGLIYDDVPSVIENLQPEVKARLLYFPTEGFQSTALGKSGEQMAPVITELMDPPRDVQKDAVNILGIFKESSCNISAKTCGTHYPTDSMELARYIQALGLKVHRAIFSGNYEYIRTAPEAAVNALNCPTWAYPVAWAMKEKFGTPHLTHCLPLGLEATRKWIRELAQFFNREEEAERLIQKEEDGIKDLWEKAKKACEGKVFLGEAGRNTLTAGSRVLAYARLAQELGMETFVFNLHPVEMKAKWYDMEYFLSDGVNPQCLSGPYAYSDPVSVSYVIKDLGLDKDQVVYFPNDVYPFARAGLVEASEVAVMDSGVHNRKVKGCPTRGVGFRGTAGLLRNLQDALRASRRKNKPTLYGRLYGQALEFDKKP